MMKSSKNIKIVKTCKDHQPERATNPKRKYIISNHKMDLKYVFNDSEMMFNDFEMILKCFVYDFEKLFNDFEMFF